MVEGGWVAYMKILGVMVWVWSGWRFGVVCFVGLRLIDGNVRNQIEWENLKDV